MDYTKIKCINPKCIEKNIVMCGHGASFGGRISHAKVKCPECGLVLLIVPMNNKYEYSINATTEEEREQDRLQKEKEKIELKLVRLVVEKIKELKELDNISKLIREK